VKQHTPKLSRLDVQILAATLGHELREWEPNVHAAYEDAKLALALRLVRELGNDLPWELTDAFENPVVLKLLEAGRAAARELPPLKQKLDGLAHELKALKGKLAQRTAPRKPPKAAKGKAPTRSPAPAAAARGGQSKRTPSPTTSAHSADAAPAVPAAAEVPA